MGMEIKKFRASFAVELDSSAQITAQLNANNLVGHAYLQQAGFAGLCMCASMQAEDVLPAL